MKIIKANSTHANRISNLICKSTDSNPNNYTEEQIKAWKGYNDRSKIIKQFEKQDIFIALKKNKLIGTIALFKNKVMGLYVSSHKFQKGIGSNLLEFLEIYAKRKCLKKLKLTATPSAVYFYKKRGYKSNGKVVVKINDIDFPEIEMEKTLISS